MNVEQLKKDLVRDEGEVLHAYVDSLGYTTIGVGRLIDNRRGGGITHDEAMWLLGNDISRVADQLNARIDCWPELDGVRQRALCNMAFQLGAGGLLKFKNMLRAIEQRDWESARREALDSTWARQTPERAGRVASMILTGKE
ncbi:MAG: glycoside hydrolase family protein [Salinisphaera sp.]|jgi:lysozyme|nr:glycoside hydrolase family protein [Salinisphaera sp.]